MHLIIYSLRSFAANFSAQSFVVMSRSFDYISNICGRTDRLRKLESVQTFILRGIEMGNSAGFRNGKCRLYCSKNVFSQKGYNTVLIIGSILNG